MARSDPQFNLRIPQELKHQIEKSAEDNGRSINAEAVYLLKKGLDQSSKPQMQHIDVLEKLTQIFTEIQSLKNHLK